MGARKPNGAAGFRCPFARDGEHEAGQSWDAATVGLSRTANSAGHHRWQPESQEHHDSDRQTGASYAPDTETGKLMHMQILARRCAGLPEQAHCDGTVAANSLPGNGIYPQLRPSTADGRRMQTTVAL